MRSMPPNAAPQMSGMINMHQPVHPVQQQSQHPHQHQQLQQQPHQQAVNSSLGGHKQPKRVAVKLNTNSRAGSQETDQPWGQQNHVSPRSQQPTATQPQQTGPGNPTGSAGGGGQNFVPESPSLMASSTGVGVGVGVGAGAVAHRHGSSSQATISGLTNQTATTSTSSNTAGPVAALAPQSPALIGNGPGQSLLAEGQRDEMDDLSECSCSSSLDCSQEEQSHSASSHLEQPLLGPGGHPMAPHRGGQPPMANHYQQQHAPPFHSQQQQQHHEHPQQQQQHHHHHHHHHHNRHNPMRGHQPHELYRGQPSHHHRYYDHQKRDMAMGGHSAQHYHPDQGPQPQPTTYKPQVHQPAHHRPLLPRASMPPSLSSAAAQHQQQPPPLFRHSTYAATSDTLTDDSPHHLYYRQQPQHQPPQQQQQQQQQQYGQTSPPPPSAALGHQMHQMGPPPRPPAPRDEYFSAGPANETDLLIDKTSSRHRTGPGFGGARRDQQEAANFKRSATAREPDSHRWRTEAPRQQTYSASDATNTLPLERGQLGQLDGVAAGGSLRRPERSQRSNPRSVAASGHKTTRRAQRPQLEGAGGEQADGQAGTSYQVAYSQQAEQHAEAPLGSRAHSSLGANTTANETNGTQLIPLNNSGGGGNGGNLLLGANSISSPAMAHGASLFEAATSTFCPPILPPLPPPVPAAIPSHRTNSPWMRLSGIILTPVGIVIVLFIVISPLLHYLM